MGGTYFMGGTKVELSTFSQTEAKKKAKVELRCDG